MMGFNLQLGDALRSESVTAIDDAIREIVRQEIARTPRSKFCESCAYMHQPEISARCCCVACHGDDVPAWAQRMSTPPSIEKTGESASSGSASGRTTVLNADSPASPASEPLPCPFCGAQAVRIPDEGDDAYYACPTFMCPGDQKCHEDCGKQGGWMLATWNRRAPAPVPFGSLGNDVEETLDALLGFGRSERMVERAQLRNEIAGLLSRRAPAPSPESEVVLDMPETDSGPLGRAQLEALHRLLAPVLDAAGFSPAHETAKKAIDRLLAQWRSGLEPRVPPCPATGESASPPSEQTAKELDELLAVFAKGDGDDEDCWTQPARRAQLYVASLRADLNDAQVQEFMHRSRGDVLAEINDGLRAEVERLRTALAEKEKAGVNANAVVERCIELVVRKKTPSWDEVSVWCDALRTALGAKEGT